jgi:hypothetical protein
MTDSFSLNELNTLSLTDCPVHALSMSGSEWVEAAWAARDAVAQGLNQERRGWFEGIKCLLRECDLPPSRVFVQRDGMV